MKFSSPILPLLLGALLGSSIAHAAAPIERSVSRHSEVRVHGAEARPIGAIDFSSSSSQTRPFGPWDVNVEAFEASGQMRFHDDGSISVDGVGRRYQHMPEAGRRCTTHGNLTVCR